MANSESYLPEHVLIFPCKTSEVRFFTVEEERPWSLRVPTVCGHTAWRKENIVSRKGTVVHTVENPYRSRGHDPVRSLLPRLFPAAQRAAGLCTRCLFGERLTRATICAWCQLIIFTGDTARLVFDPSHISTNAEYPTTAVWDPEWVLVCARSSCKTLVRRYPENNIVAGAWHRTHTLIVLPR